MATLVLALAGLTAGSGPAEKAATAQPTVSFAGHWRGAIQDDLGPRNLDWYDGEATWGAPRWADQRGKMLIIPDGRSRALVIWEGRSCFGWGRDKGTPIPWREVYRGKCEVQGDRIVLRLVPTLPTPQSFVEAFVKPTRGPVRITLEPVKAQR